MYLKYTAHKANIYTIWYIKCNNIFDNIRMRKYPWKFFNGIVVLKDTLI